MKSFICTNCGVVQQDDGKTKEFPTFCCFNFLPHVMTNMEALLVQRVESLEKQVDNLEDRQMLGIRL